MYFAYNPDGKLTDIESSGLITPGNKVELGVVGDYNSDTKTRTLSLLENSKIVAEKSLGNIRNVGRNHKGLEIGKDLKTPVSSAYKVPFAFTGKIRKVTIDIK